MLSHRNCPSVGSIWPHRYNRATPSTFGLESTASGIEPPGVPNENTPRACPHQPVRRPQKSTIAKVATMMLVAVRDRDLKAWCNVMFALLNRLSSFFTHHQRSVPGRRGRRQDSLGPKCISRCDSVQEEDALCSRFVHQLAISDKIVVYILGKWQWPEVVKRIA